MPLDSDLKLRVVIGEDEGLTRLRLSMSLQRLGVTVVGTAANGEEAVRATRELRPDVVLMDIQMPELDGLQALRRIMTECPTPVVMLTAYSDLETVQRAEAAGAVGYLSKPILDEELGPEILRARERFSIFKAEQEKQTLHGGHRWEP